MAKTEYFYGVHSVESLLELEPERVLTLFALKGRDDQRLKRVLELAEPFGISVSKQAEINWKNLQVSHSIKVLLLLFVLIQL